MKARFRCLVTVFSHPLSLPFDIKDLSVELTEIIDLSPEPIDLGEQFKNKSNNKICVRLHFYKEKHLPNETEELHVV